jgi:hypothetical protein
MGINGRGKSNQMNESTGAGESERKFLADSVRSKV